MTAVQLALDLHSVLGDTEDDDRWYDTTQDPDWHDLADHQRGRFVVPFDTAGGQGELRPAWACCRCGRAEPNRYLLEINHACNAARPYCTSRPGLGMRPVGFALLEAA